MAGQPCWKPVQESPQPRSWLPPMPSSSCRALFGKCRYEHSLDHEPQPEAPRASSMSRSGIQPREVRSMIPVAKAKLLEPKKGLVVGIANDPSIAWGCAKAFRALGAELAVTYLNDKAKKYVEPLARELEAPILVPLDVAPPGQIEAVFERIKSDWGELDFVVHSIAFSPGGTLQGRIVDAPRDGFLTTME